jgi:gentisate 1,2-dioxygenase
MTKEFALEHYEKEGEKNKQLMEMEKQTLIRNMESMLEELKNDSYVNSYKWDKCCKAYEEYQRYRKETQHNIEIYNVIKTLEG